MKDCGTFLSDHISPNFHGSINSLDFPQYSLNFTSFTINHSKETNVKANKKFKMAPIIAAAPRLLTAAIAAVAWSSNRLDVFKLGPSADLQHLWWGGMSRTPFASASHTLSISFPPSTSNPLLSAHIP